MTPPRPGVGPGVDVEIWSDVVCPWCAVGKRRFEAALARFKHRDAVVVRWRAFELDPTTVSPAPGAPVEPGGYVRRLAAKYGGGTARAQQMLDTMTATAAAEGLDLRFDRVVPANTVDAHQLIHLAGHRGVQGAVTERLLRAHFTEGEAVGDPEVLVRLGAEAGLDPEEARAVLAEGRYRAAVRADVAEAAALGVRGVPFFAVDRRYGVSGAQEPDALLAVLERAWAERPGLAVVGARPSGSAAGACGPDGCAV
jgi:predicted DsbA family dithiol-disulfide isomerase